MCQIDGSQEEAMFMETSAIWVIDYDSSQNFGVFKNSKKSTGNHCFLGFALSELFYHRNLNIYTVCDQLYCHKTFLNFS